MAGKRVLRSRCELQRMNNRILRYYPWPDARRQVQNPTIRQARHRVTPPAAMSQLFSLTAPTKVI